MVGVTPSCALLGGFAHGFRCYGNSGEREMPASACTRCMPGFDCADTAVKVEQIVFSGDREGNCRSVGRAGHALPYIGPG